MSRLFAPLALGCILLFTGCQSNSSEPEPNGNGNGEDPIAIHGDEDGLFPPLDVADGAASDSANVTGVRAHGLGAGDLVRVLTIDLSGRRHESQMSASELDLEPMGLERPEGAVLAEREPALTVTEGRDTTRYEVVWLIPMPVNDVVAHYRLELQEPRTRRERGVQIVEGTTFKDDEAVIRIEPGPDGSRVTEVVRTRNEGW